MALYSGLFNRESPVKKTLPFAVAHWDDPNDPPHGSFTSSPVSLAVGVFDGVHLGHQELLKRAYANARQVSGGIPAVLTFDPNPARLIHPHTYPGDLSTRNLRFEFFAQAGIEQVVLVQFNQDFSNLRGIDFLEKIIHLFPCLESMVVGFNFHLGHKRDVNVDRLSRWMAERSVRVDIVPALKDNNRSISSSRIRHAVAVGDLELAALLLGRPYTVGVDGYLPSHRSESNQLLPPPGTYDCTYVSEATNREGMIRVSRDGTLQWEHVLNDIHYVLLRRKSHADDS